MNFLLDTNILLHYIRRDAVAQQIDEMFRPFLPSNRVIVSIGEIKSIARQSSWEQKKMILLERLLETIFRADLTLDIVERYAEIDAYSQGKSSTHSLGITARNMGKNDLWIAATASVLNIKLLTTDSDFNHLAGVYLDLEKISLV